MFGEVVEQNGVIGLAWHVDYWDYLGWKDTFSSREATSRQHSYASAMHAQGVYTPQIIINGEMVCHPPFGIDEENSSFRQSIASALSGSLPVNLNAKVLGDDMLVVNVGNGEGSAILADLVLVTFASVENVAIECGEIAGVTVTYRHVVSGVQDIGMWKGKRLTLELPEFFGGEDSTYGPKKGRGCAILLQTMSNGALGAILGAA